MDLMGLIDGYAPAALAAGEAASVIAPAHARVYLRSGMKPMAGAEF